TPLHVQSNDMPETTGYIVHLKEGVDKDVHFQWLQPQLSPDCEITHDYTIIHGYAGDFCQEAVDALRASDHVKRIEKVCDQALMEQSPWGLNRISQGKKLTTQDTRSDDFTYFFNDWSEVDIYFMETGYRLDHVEFEDRARWGFIRKETKKTGKHGTAVVSAAAGKTCGPAKHANIVACVVYRSATSKRKIPAVINMSFGFEDSSNDNTTFGDALEKGHSSNLKFAWCLTVADGIHVCAAAGNSGIDAKDVTPARVKGCNAIGSCSIEDKRLEKSNYGAIVKMFAPGENIYVAKYTAVDAYWYRGGTSYACPYVAGMIAYFLALHGNKPPADMTSFLQSIALCGVLEDIPEGTMNLLAYNALTGRGIMKDPYDV
ncbi:hypothetical protein PHLGIDRAFT_71697, partial [Phlebiopsis gigantea 11061_1 CR5-6]